MIQASLQVTATLPAEQADAAEVKELYAITLPQVGSTGPAWLICGAIEMCRGAWTERGLWEALLAEWLPGMLGKEGEKPTTLCAP